MPPLARFAKVSGGLGAAFDFQWQGGVMKRSAWGTLALSVSFLLGTIIAVGSFVSMRGRLDTATFAAQPLNASTILVACLDPFAILLEIVAIGLIVADSRRIGNPHRVLAWTAAIFFGLWAVVNLGVFVPLSFVGMRQGSLALVRAGQLAKAGAALLQYAVPFLLVYGLSRKWPRTLLWLALVLTVIGNFGVVVLPMRGLELEMIEAGGQVMYAPRFSVDYTSGAYPVLLGMGYVGGALYLIVYALLTARFFKGAQPA
jgi:hypothetical protein